MTEPFTADLETLARAEAFIASLPLDGTLVPLGRKVAGKDLSLMARYITSPFSALGKYAPTDTHGSFFLLNIFGNNGNGPENAGFIDWAIQDGVATCSNIQMYITPKSSHEEVAAEVFGHPFMQDGFMVEEGYLRNGIGSFLAALSLVTLSRIGAIGIMPINPGGYATENAQSTWRKFGIETRTTPKQPFSLALAAAHPQVTRKIAAFV